MSTSSDRVSPQPGAAPTLWTGRHRQLLARLAVSLLIAGGLFWAMRKGGLPMLPPQEAYDRLQIGMAALYLPLHSGATFLRTYRWNHLLRPLNPNLSSFRVLGVSLIGLAGVMFAPLRTGEVVRPWLLAQDGEVGFVPAAGTVVAERIVDGLMLMLVLAASLSLAPTIDPLPNRLGNLELPLSIVPAVATSALLTFAAAFAAMALFYFWRALAHKLVDAVLGVVSKPFAGWATRQVDRLADSLQFLLSKRHGLALFRDTAGYWALVILATWMLLLGVDAKAGLDQAAVIVGVMGLSTLLPSGPGFFGTYQLGAYCGLAMFFPESTVLSSGAMFTFVSYTVQLGVAALGLFVGFWLMAKTAPRQRHTTAA